MIELLAAIDDSLSTLLRAICLAAGVRRIEHSVIARILAESENDVESAKQYTLLKDPSLTIEGSVDDYESDTIWIRISGPKSIERRCEGLIANLLPVMLGVGVSLLPWDHPVRTAGYLAQMNQANLAVITVRQILEGTSPVLYVTHDADDGGWQFLTGAGAAPCDARVVSLGNMLKHDSSLQELADLPFGWKASRPSADATWIRSLLS